MPETDRRSRIFHYTYNMSARYTMAVLGSVGMGIIYGLKVALHIAIVSMVNHTSTTPDEGNITTSQCDFGELSEEKLEDGPFDWSHTIQGLLLSSYFWGYLVSQLPGGRIAELLSAKYVMLFAVLINIICTLASPILSKINWIGLLVMRILMGIGGGVTFPSMHVLIAHWAPPDERGVMSNIVYAGTALGSVIFTLITGLIAGTLGWEAVFYVEGGISLLWVIFWLWLISDTPEQQSHITEKERTYIMEQLKNETEIEHGKSAVHPQMPWLKALTSLPFLAILIAHTCGNWGWYMVLIELPTYMKTMLNFQINSNAVFSSIPFFSMWIFSMILSKVLQVLMLHHVLSATVARKIATGFASIVPLGCFLTLCFIECNRMLAVILMTVAITAIGGMFSGYLSNHIDIAPNFAGTLMAITNTVATIPGIIVPIFVGSLEPTMESWRLIFFVTIGLYSVEIFIYMIFASAYSGVFLNFFILLLFLALLPLIRLTIK